MGIRFTIYGDDGREELWAAGSEDLGIQVVDRLLAGFQINHLGLSIYVHLGATCCGSNLEAINSNIVS